MKKAFFDTPAYTVPESASLLRIPESTLSSWVSGRTYKTSGGVARSEPIIAPAGLDPRFLSFNNLVEAHVLSAIRQQRVSIENIRKAILFCRKKMGTQRPLLDEQFQTDGVSLFVEELGKLINVSRDGQLGMKDVFKMYLRRIERNTNGIPIRLFPFTHSSPDNRAPRNIVIDPVIAFGRPSIARCGIPVKSITDQFKAGDSIDDLMDDFGLKREEVEEAIRACPPDRAA